MTPTPWDTTVDDANNWHGIGGRRDIWQQAWQVWREPLLLLCLASEYEFVYYQDNQI